MTTLEEIRSYQKTIQCAACGKDVDVNHRVQFTMCQQCLKNLLYQLEAFGETSLEVTQCDDNIKVALRRTF